MDLFVVFAIFTEYMQVHQNYNNMPKKLMNFSISSGETTSKQPAINTNFCQTFYGIRTQIY